MTKTKLQSKLLNSLKSTKRREICQKKLKFTFYFQLTKTDMEILEMLFQNMKAGSNMTGKKCKKMTNLIDKISISCIQSSRGTLCECQLGRASISTLSRGSNL